MEKYYYGYNGKPEQNPSAWNNWPTKESPDNKFKYFGFEISNSPDLKQIDRSTYGILDWMGDCGGLFDALLIIGSVIVNPFSVLALQSRIAFLLVKQQKNYPTNAS